MIASVLILFSLVIIFFFTKPTTELVVFKAPRSRECNALKKFLVKEELAQFDSVYIIDIIDNPKIKQQFGINTVPTSIIIQGKYETEIARIEGYSKQTYAEWIKENTKRQS